MHSFGELSAGYWIITHFSDNHRAQTFVIVDQNTKEEKTISVANYFLQQYKMKISADTPLVCIKGTSVLIISAKNLHLREQVICLLRCAL